MSTHKNKYDQEARRPKTSIFDNFFCYFSHEQIFLLLDNKAIYYSIPSRRLEYNNLTNREQNVSTIYSKSWTDWEIDSLSFSRIFECEN